MSEDFIVGDVSNMLTVDSRIKSFQRTSIVDGKKFRWRYTLIPYESMARLGFFYCPSRDSTTGIVYKDAVGCIYCRRVTHDLKDCRSKRKDVVETLMSVLRQHWETHEPRCLYSYMKWKILQGFNGDWNEDEWFRNPLDARIKRLFAFTYENNWPHSNDVNLNSQRMADAGLVRYDNSFTGFEELMSEKDTDACYCIYCKQILGHWQLDDDPLKEHFKASQGGQCFFFSKIDGDLVESIRETVEIPQEHHTNDEDDRSDAHSSPQVSSSPMRKKRKLKRNNTQLISDDSDPSFHLDEAKDLVLNFRAHRERINELGRKNPILDDSKDEFSFSTHGNNAFEIPSPSSKTLARPDTIVENTSRPGSSSAMLPTQNKVSRGDLRSIPIDAELSSNSSSLSGPIPAPPAQLDNQRSIAFESRNLSPLQRKIC
ncbi:hypothetical protein ZYGR_0AD04910 [Zygosaccharomyces rouxii]|uniref:Uncharacterized protein n=1 Tax=Zygosaccharomyces rouxii TaxID=4956 RepID=A0A1Q3A6M0_ZYGRO|nr:hypothetical protein ZYGR_0AD04910 [Zygosaccharomyces rouxii]